MNRWPDARGAATFGMNSQGRPDPATDPERHTDDH